MCRLPLVSEIAKMGTPRLHELSFSKVSRKHSDYFLILHYIRCSQQSCVVAIHIAYFHKFYTYFCFLTSRFRSFQFQKDLPNELMFSIAALIYPDRHVAQTMFFDCNIVRS